MADSEIRWEPPVIELYLDENRDVLPIKLTRRIQRSILINDYLQQIRPNTIIAIFILLISIVLMLISDPDSVSYKFGFSLGIVVVGVKFCLRVLVNIGFVSFAKIGKNISYRLSRNALICYDNDKEIERIDLKEVRHAVVQNIKYIKGNRWLLKFKHKNRKWYVIELPTGLHDEIESLLIASSVPTFRSVKNY
jgi:hypothetical protein